jgi:hypothetical protein
MPKLIKNQDFHQFIRDCMSEQLDDNHPPVLIIRLFGRGHTQHRNIINAVKSETDSSVFYLRSKEQTP